MTSGNQMVDDQDIANNPTPFDDEYETLKDTETMFSEWVMIYENALDWLDTRQVELPISVYNQLKDTLVMKYKTSEESLQEARDAVESHLSGSDFEE